MVGGFGIGSLLALLLLLLRSDLTTLRSARTADRGDGSGPAGSLLALLLFLPWAFIQRNLFRLPHCTTKPDDVVEADLDTDLYSNPSLLVGWEFFFSITLFHDHITMSKGWVNGGLYSGKLNSDSILRITARAETTQNFEKSVCAEFTERENWEKRQKITSYDLDSATTLREKGVKHSYGNQ